MSTKSICSMKLAGVMITCPVLPKPLPPKSRQSTTDNPEVMQLQTLPLMSQGQFLIVDKQQLQAGQELNKSPASDPRVLGL